VGGGDKMTTCEECKIDNITEKVQEYSKKNFNGRILCFNCQKKVRENSSENKPLPPVKAELVSDEQINGSEFGMIFNNTILAILDQGKFQEIDNYFDTVFDKLLQLEIRKRKQLNVVNGWGVK
jgi:hypothetical protein